MDQLLLFVPLALTVAAVIADLRTDRIPNALIAAGFAMGTCLRLLEGEALTLPGAAAGALLPLVFPGALFFLGMLGAGDVKLLMLLGVFFGWRGIARITAAALVFGGVQALLLVLTRKNARKRLACLKDYAGRCVRQRRLVRYSWAGGEAESDGAMHFTVSILAGLVWYILCPGV